jgi:anthranilate synthase component 2
MQAAGKRLLLVDNYDSFTYNLVHLLEQLPDVEVTVLRNDALYPGCWKGYHAAVLSPGPGLPEESGQLLWFIKNTVGIIPLLGICLGHQALALHFGAELFCMSEPVHGKATALVDLQPHRLWHQLQEPIQVGRYHSWAVKAAGLKTNLRVLASDQNGNPMAAEYPGFRAVGLQFHPESILTPQGDRILKNWWEGLPQNH